MSEIKADVEADRHDGFFWCTCGAKIADDTKLGPVRKCHQCHKMVLLPSEKAEALRECVKNNMELARLLAAL